MDDDAYERLLAKRERNARFYALDYAARHPKPVKAPRKPRAPRPRTTTGNRPGRPSTMPPDCQKCGVGLRPYGAPAASAPGTRAYHGRGMCKACANGRTHRIGRPKERPDNCRACDRPMRDSSRYNLSQRPGTVPSAKGGFCRTCEKRNASRC